MYILIICLHNSNKDTTYKSRKQDKVCWGLQPLDMQRNQNSNAQEKC
jgi:hypothetical protein